MLTTLLVSSILSLGLMNVGLTDPHRMRTWDPSLELAEFVTESYPGCAYYDPETEELPAHVFVWVTPLPPVPVTPWIVSIWGGDFNRNGTPLEAADFLFFSRCYFKAAAHIAANNLGLSCASADINNSGFVDAPDLLLYAALLQSAEPDLTFFGIPEADSLENADQWALNCGA